MTTTIPVSPLYRLDRTLSCGQAFRWRWEDGAASGIFAGRQVRLRQERHGLFVEGLSRSQLPAFARYIGADEHLERIEGILCRDRILRRILPHTSGISMMRQDPWDCLVSSIISAFNNIPKIELTLARLSQRFGVTFPTPKALAGTRLSDLRACLLGYRAPYLLEVARRISSGAFDLSELADLPYDQARKALLTLPGVGSKVADCVLLFAYGKQEAFPVDVWVKRAVERWYLNGRTMTENRIREFGQERFGSLAGYAQQHLYYYIRERGNRETRKRD